MSHLYKLLLNSVVEQDRFSPRLLSNFVFVALFALCVIRGEMIADIVVAGQLVTGHAPEYVYSTLATVVFGIFGLGKVAEIAEKFTKPKAEATSTTTTTTEFISPLAGYDDGPGGLRPRE